jgi:hypothetical protein
MSFWGKFVIGWSKLNSTSKSTTTASISRWTLRWGSGCANDYCIGRWHHWRLKGVTSWDHATSGHFRSPRRLAPWRTGCASQQVCAFTTCSTLRY